MRSQPLPGAIKARAGWLWSSQGGAPVSGSEPWPPATVDLASAPRAHLTSERPAARAQLEFGRASSLAAAVRTAAGEDRTHDLRIMRPTRCQLRYCRLEYFQTSTAAPIPKLKHEARSRYSSWAYQMTAVGFEPTPLRTGAWSQRLRPLGQTVMNACEGGPSFEHRPMQHAALSSGAAALSSTRPLVADLHLGPEGEARPRGLWDK